MPKQKIGKKRKFFETWLPRLFEGPLVVLSTALVGYTAYGVGLTVTASAGIVHTLIPTLILCYAIYVAVSYLIAKENVIHDHLVNLGRFLDNPKDWWAFLCKYKKPLLMALIATSLALFLLFPPASLVPIIGAGGTVAMTLGFEAASKLAYVIFMVSLSMFGLSLLTSILHGLKHGFKKLFLTEQVKGNYHYLDNPYTAASSHSDKIILDEQAALTILIDTKPSPLRLRKRTYSDSDLRRRAFENLNETARNLDSAVTHRL